MRIPCWIKKGISLKDYTTFKIGGKASYFAEISEKGKLIKTLKWAKEHSLPFFILGNGSNVLFSDKGYRGIIIKIQNSKFKIQNNSIKVGAGLLLVDFLTKCVKNNLSGFEWMAGIPGTIGGAVYGNAGAFGWEVKDFFKWAKTINPKTFQEKIYSFKQCRFGYRESIFKKSKNKNDIKEIIWEVALKIRKGEKKDIQEKINGYLEHKIRQGMFKYPSAGSVFKNILIKDTPYYNFYNPRSETINIKGEEATVKKGKISAGWFIEKCGLKEKRSGGAKISDFHANLIVNFNKAKAKDILFLIKFIKKKVFEKFKIKLEEEIMVLSP